MPLVIDSVEYLERGAPLFRSIQLEIKENELVRLFSQQPHVSSALLNIIHFRIAAVNSYIAINGQKLYRKAENMILLPAAGLLPKTHHSNSLLLVIVVHGLILSKHYPNSRPPKTKPLLPFRRVNSGCANCTFACI